MHVEFQLPSSRSNWGTSLNEYLTPHRKIWDPLNISGTMRDRKVKFYTHSDRAKYSFQVSKFYAKEREGGAAPTSVNLGPHLSRKLLELESWNSTNIHIAPSTLFRYEIFSATGHAGGAAPPSVNLGPLISRKLLELESWNFALISIGPSTPLRYEHFSARGRAGAQRPLV